MLYKDFCDNIIHLEPDQVPVFEIKLNLAFETFSMMSTVIHSDYHEVVAVRVLQVTGED